MASAEFKVTPEDIEKTADSIQGKADDFRTAHESIYQVVEALEQSEAFVGDAGTEFRNRLDQYKPNFENADTALEKYIEFLRDYAADMRKAEEELKTIASSLGKAFGNK